MCIDEGERRRRLPMMEPRGMSLMLVGCENREWRRVCFGLIVVVVDLQNREIWFYFGNFVLLVGMGEEWFWEIWL